MKQHFLSLLKQFHQVGTGDKRSESMETILTQITTAVLPKVVV